MWPPRRPRVAWALAPARGLALFTARSLDLPRDLRLLRPRRAPGPRLRRRDRSSDLGIGPLAPRRPPLARPAPRSDPRDRCRPVASSRLPRRVPRSARCPLRRCAPRMARIRRDHSRTRRASRRRPGPGRTPVEPCRSRSEPPRIGSGLARASAVGRADHRARLMQRRFFA